MGAAQAVGDADLIRHQGQEGCATTQIQAIALFVDYN
jgi:hypothetical protein